MVEEPGEPIGRFEDRVPKNTKMSRQEAVTLLATQWRRAEESVLMSLPELSGDGEVMFEDSIANGDHCLVLSSFDAEGNKILGGQLIRDLDGFCFPRCG